MIKIEINQDITPGLLSEIQAQITSELPVFINIASFGGSPEEAFSIYHFLQSLPQTVTTCLGAYGYSAAALIFAAGARRIALPESTLMLHKSWTLSAGNTDQMQLNAEILENIDTLAFNLLERSSSMTAQEIKNKCSDDFYMFGKSIHARGFATDFVQNSKQLHKLIVDDNINKMFKSKNTMPNKQDSNTQSENRELNEIKNQFQEFEKGFLEMKAEQKTAQEAAESAIEKERQRVLALAKIAQADPILIESITQGDDAGVFAQNLLIQNASREKNKILSTSTDPFTAPCVSDKKMGLKEHMKKLKGEQNAN